jgi:hypothetical protein
MYVKYALAEELDLDCARKTCVIRTMGREGGGGRNLGLKRGGKGKRQRGGGEIYKEKEKKEGGGEERTPEQPTQFRKGKEREDEDH